jgi:hypothetical protein
MAEDKWISVADAAEVIGTEDAQQLIQQAWKRGAIRLHGVRPGESESVEIPSSEGGRIDCIESRVGEGGLFTTYHSVTMKWYDVERLAQADFERLVARETREAASSAPQQNEIPSDFRESISLTRAVAVKLRQLHPDGPPLGLPRKDLANQVREAAGATIGTFGLTTLDRARALAWPRPKRGKRQQGS